MCKKMLDAEREVCARIVAGQWTDVAEKLYGDWMTRSNPRPMHEGGRMKPRIIKLSGMQRCGMRHS